MIKEFEKYHGLVLSRMLHESKNHISIETYPSNDNASYIINGSIGLYIKYSKKRISPWRFTFMKEHQDEVLKMKKKFTEVFIVFVCHDDGIAALSYEELKIILDEVHEEVEWVAIKRRRREKYSVSGHDGKLKFKIGENEFPSKIIGVTKNGDVKHIAKKFVSHFGL